MNFLNTQVTPNGIALEGQFPLNLDDELKCNLLDGQTTTQAKFPMPPEEPSVVGINCLGCVTPSSNDPATVEYYGYASDSSWCDCVQAPAICNSTLVLTTEGNKLGYYCIAGETGEVQCLIQNNGCIYPSRSGCPAFYNPCPETCSMPGNFIASKVFVNPYNAPVDVFITGSVDDDAILSYNGTTLWFGSGLSNVGACEAGNVNYNFSIGPYETFTITAYDTVGVCGNVDLCAYFSLI